MRKSHLLQSNHWCSIEVLSDATAHSKHDLLIRRDNRSRLIEHSPRVY